MMALIALARPEAILDLRTDQIDLEHWLIDLNPHGRKQTKKRRPVVSISRSLLPWPETVSDGPVVNYYGRPIRSIKTVFRAARRRAGLGVDVTPCALRHTMAA